MKKVKFNRLFLRFLLLIFVLSFVFGYLLKLDSVKASISKPVKYVNTPLVISDNQFWSSDYDYVVSSSVTVSATGTLSIENGANIYINEKGSFIINSGLINVGSLLSEFSKEKVVDYFSVINNSSSSLINLKLLDDTFNSLPYKSSVVSDTNIQVLGTSTDNVFSVVSGGRLNMRKVKLSGSMSNNLARTIFSLYRGSRLNVFESSFSDIKTSSSQAFYADNYSSFVFYKTNISNFSVDSFFNLFKGVNLFFIKSKIDGISSNKVINLLTGAVLNFQQSSINSIPASVGNDRSGICVNTSGSTTILFLDSDMGPCFIGFYLSGSGYFNINQNNFSKNGDVVLNYTPTISNFKNNWWGSSLGPKQTDLSSLPINYSSSDYVNIVKNQNSIEDRKGTVVSLPFSNVPFRASSPCCSSVLFIPGIQGSRLYKKGVLGVENQLWEPNRNKDVESLYLNSFGESLGQNIYTKDLIYKTNSVGSIGAVDVYQGVIDLLNQEKTSGDISDFQVLPYDWRFLPSSIVNFGIKNETYTTYIKDKIKQMASSSPSGKVIILAHSYGGLIAKYVSQSMEKDGDDGKIESIILTTVPEYGTPQAITSDFYGDGEEMLNGLILNKNNAINFAKNMLSANLLLPSDNYFSQSDLLNNQKNIINFDNWTYLNLGLKKMTVDSLSLMIDSLSKFMPINRSILDKAESEHANIDNFSPNLSAKTYSIVGVGIPTLSGLNFTKPKCRGFFFCQSSNKPDFNRNFSLMGDGVVIAHNLSTRTGSVFTIDLGKENEARKNDPIYYKEDAIGHTNIFRSSGVKDLLSSILGRVKKESLGINSFSELNNPYVSYVSGSLSKPGPILGSYGNSSVLSKIQNISDDASNSDFHNRFSKSDILIAEAYGPIVLKSNYKDISDLQNKTFEEIKLTPRTVNTINYSDGNRSGIVSVVPAGSQNFGVYGQGGGIGIGQIVLKINNTELIYPNISVSPSTNIDINYSTTTILVDNNADGKIDKEITPIQINTSTSSTSTDPYSTSTQPTVEEIFNLARLKIKNFIDSKNNSTSTNSGSLSDSSIYIANKYIEKINIAERKYQKSGLLQSLSLIKDFYSILESNMATCSSIINTYNKEHDFYVFNNLSVNSSRVLFLTQRQKDMRDEMLAYTEILESLAEVEQKLASGL